MKAVKSNQFYQKKSKENSNKKPDIKEFHFSKTFFVFTFDLGFQISLEDVSTAWVFWKHCYCCLDVSGLCVLMPSSWLEDKFSFFFFFSWIGKNAFSPSTHQLPKILMMLCPVNNSLTVWDIFYKILLSVYVQQLTCPYIYYLSCSILYQIWVSDKFFSWFNCLFSEIAEQISSSRSLK